MKWWRTASVAIALVGIAVTAPRPTHADTGWTMTVVGDIMLDRNVWSKIKTFGRDYPFAKIRSQLRGSDIVLGNLEGPFTNSTRHAVSGGALSFTFDPSLVPTLKSAGFTTLLLANNHTLNQGQAGLDNTRRLLKKHGLDYYGDPRNRRGYHLTKTVNGHRITLLGFDQLDGTMTNVLTDIRNAHAKGEYVIVTPHWGTEYQLGIQPKLQRLAKQLIDAGADMVIGGHPHVVEPFEIYKGKFIAYSLGNFVFDQYFSYDTQEELMLKFTFTASTITITLEPITSVRSQPVMASTRARAKLLERLATGSVVSRSVRDMIRRGTITLSIP